MMQATVSHLQPRRTSLKPREEPILLHAALGRVEWVDCGNVDVGSTTRVQLAEELIATVLHIQKRTWHTYIPLAHG